MEGLMRHSRVLRWMLLGFLLYSLISCSSLPKTEGSPEIYEIAPAPRSDNPAVRSWFDGIQPIYAGWGLGTAFAVGRDDTYEYWMTAHHVVGKYQQVRIGTRIGTVIALEKIQDLAIVRTLITTTDAARIHSFARTSVGDRAVGIGYSYFSRRLVTVIHIGHIVSKDFTGKHGNWKIVTNGGGRGGMSGGPLFNTNRAVIGVCSFFADTGINRTANPTELVYVPGVVAGAFWAHVQTDLINKQIK